MKNLDFGRYALSTCAAVALLEGCSQSQPPIGAPDATPQGAGRVNGAYAQERAPQSVVGPNALVEFAYVTYTNSNHVSAYRINATSGALTQVRGSPFRAGTSPGDVAVDPAGTFAYVTNSDSNNISAYRINATSGALAQVKGSPFKAGIGPLGVAADPTGKFIYVTNLGYGTFFPGNVFAYRVNATSGALKQVKGSPFRAAPNRSVLMCGYSSPGSGWGVFMFAAIP